MHLRLLEVLACPKCFGGFQCTPAELDENQQVISGSLECVTCKRSYPIRSSIPRFVDDNHYAASFGYQWNRFRLEQIDTDNGKKLSSKRFYAETGWTNQWLNGKWVLDVGCGAGRFLDVASKSSAEVVGVDVSNAVDAAGKTLDGRRNVHLVQASIYELPFRPGTFDGCYCIGVIQHTPDQKRALQCLPRVLKPAGRLAVTVYERKPWTHLNAKYIVRPLTRRLNKRFLLFFIKGVMPIVFPVTEILFRIPYAGRLFMFAIPVANYVNERNLSLKERYRWAILDTFDMLSPEYDCPQTFREVQESLSQVGVRDIRRLTNDGINVVGQIDA